MKTARDRIFGVTAVVIACIVSIVICSGCDKSGDNPTLPPTVITENDAADIIGSSLSDSMGTYGLAAQFKAAAGVVKSGHPISVDTVVTISSPVLGDFFYAYTFHFVYAYGYPEDSMVFRYTSRGDCRTPYLVSTDSVSAVLKFTHITTQDSEYVVNGNYTRKGSHVLKTREKHQFTSIITDTLENINVNRATGQVDFGIAIINVSGQASDGASFSFSGTLTFTGYRQATLIMNDLVYWIDLDSGSVTPAELKR